MLPGPDKENCQKQYLEKIAADYSSQNKNWCLLSFLVYLVNSNDICAQEIILKYFEAGHTFMSADRTIFKHQKRTYDFKDFAKAVEVANKGNVNLKKKNELLLIFINGKIIRHNLTLLRDIVSIKAECGKYVLFTKSQFNEETYKTLDFAQKQYMNKKGMSLQSSHTKKN